MNFYSCKVRLAGSLHNEVDKIGVSAPEIMVLRHIHGADMVVSIRKTSDKPTRHDVERSRLINLYGPKAVETLFGQAHQDLPTVAPNLAPEAELPEPTDDEEVERPVLPAAGGDGLKELAG